MIWFIVMILNQLNFHDFDFDLKSPQVWFYPTLLIWVDL